MNLHRACMTTRKNTLDAFLGTRNESNDGIRAQTKRMLDLADFSDEEWTFKVANTKEFTHFIFNEYPARMIPQVARKLIKMYYPNHDNPRERKPMLDPFGGSGTSCVEALLRDIDSVAFDLNPLAHLIEKVKTIPLDPTVLQHQLKLILRAVSASRGTRFPECIPPVPQIEFWFNEQVITDLSTIKHVILATFPEGNPGTGLMPASRSFFMACLGKAARDCSYQRKGENKTYRMEKEKMVEFDKKINTLQRFTDVATAYISAMADMHAHYRENKFTAKCKAILGNSMILEGIPDNSIDLVVTSPPYGDSQTTVAYGQFSRFPLEWVLADTSGVKEIDAALLGGVENEQEFPASRLLLETCKDIMAEQCKQQQRLVAAHLAAIEPCDMEEVKIVMGGLASYFINRLPLINGTGSFQELASWREEYYATLSAARSAGARGNKWLDARSLGKAGKFKIYDDRLGYVLSFFSDFSKVLARLFQVLDRDRKCCLVVGNRTVKTVQIPTDRIMIELGITIGFEHHATFYRDIPNKRMPLSNSPSNVPGEVSPTMDKEIIVVLTKPAKK
jgi:site-specific DNA-methyltransferase (cytosine-N4-specific)